MATAAALIALGLPLAAIWMAGLRRLVRDDDVHAFRPLGDAYPVLLALSLVLGSKLYYTSGLLLVQLAAGGVPVECWLARNRRGPAFLAAVAGPVIVVGWDRREYLTG